MEKETNIEKIIGKNIKVSNLSVESNLKNIIGGEIKLENKVMKAYIIKVEKINIRDSYIGKIIGIIQNENEKIVIVSSEDSKMDYVELVSFFKDFDCLKGFKYKCQFEKSSGAVLYKIIEGKPQFLVIYSKKNFPGFPKGYVEYGESEQQTAIREVREEVGINIQLKANFRESISYIVCDTAIKKTVIFFLAEIDQNQTININENEVNKFEFVTYEKAKDILNDELFNIIEIANKYIEGN